ncbi:MAG: hypothetical protein ACRENG_37830 [bacterium]
MQKSASRGILLLLMMLVIGGCAASSSGSKSASLKYTADLGTATTFDFREKSQRALNKYQYVIERFEEYGNILYLETQWKDREVFADEQTSGVVEAKSRIILEARPFTRSSAGVTKLNKVEFAGENLVIFENTQTWASVPMTPMCKAYFKRFADDLRTEFRTGFRRY